MKKEAKRKLKKGVKNLAVIAVVGITLYNATKFIPKLQQSNNIGSNMVKKLTLSGEKKEEQQPALSSLNKFIKKQQCNIMGGRVRNTEYKKNITSSCILEGIPIKEMFGEINNVVEYENILECNLNDDSCLNKINSIHWCRTLDGEIWYDSKKKKNYCTFEQLDGEHKTIGELLKCDLDDPNDCNF